MNSIINEDNARVIMRLCNLSDIDWYVRDGEGRLHLVVSVKRDE